MTQVLLGEKKSWKLSSVTRLNPHRKRNKSLWHLLMYTISLKHLFLPTFCTSFLLLPMLLLFCVFWPSGDDLACRWYQKSQGYCIQLCVSILVNLSPWSRIWNKNQCKQKDGSDFSHALFIHVLQKHLPFTFHLFKTMENKNKRYVAAVSLARHKLYA